MDQQAQDAMRAHYDSHSNQHLNSQEAERARRAGGAFQLKKLHNDIKRALINRFASGKQSLLDLACGRGGDIRKWVDAGLKHVVGIDLSPGEIAEARKRFSELLQQQPGTEMTAEFVASPELGQSEQKQLQQFDAVTCMFAIHYFFASERALRQLLHNVSINLKAGGYFFGTVPDGKRVLAALNRQDSLDSPMLQLASQTFCDQGDCVASRSKPSQPCALHGKPAPQPFGSAYTCAIGDTVTAGKGESLGSFEYLVYESVLKGMASSFGLEPVINLGPRLEHFFDVADAGRLFKHFRPEFRDCDPSLCSASALFMAFAFRKPPQPQPVQPLAPAQPLPTVTDEASPAEQGAKRPLEQPTSGAAQQPANESDEPEVKRQAVAARSGLKRPGIRRRGGKVVEKPQDGVSKQEGPE